MEPGPGIGGIGLLTVPALRDADWPSFLAVVTAIALGSARAERRTHLPAILLGPIGVFDSLVTGPAWAGAGCGNVSAVPVATWVSGCARSW